MAFEIKVTQEQAEKEVNDLLDKKMMFPKQRLAIERPIAQVVEAIMYGYVTIGEDEKISQTLVKPTGNITELNYVANVAPMTMQKNLKEIKNYTQANVNLAYICAYTGQLSAVIDKLEPVDRSTADAISFFFQ